MIGSNIRRIRLEKSMTQEELGKSANVGRATINRYESGSITNIPYDRILRIAKALNVTPGTLMGWEEENPQGKEAENDLYSDITLRMMNDEEFAAAVECLYRMDQEQLQSFRKLFSR